jgi:hypothetical protein
MYLRDERINSLACYVDGIIHGLEIAGIRNTDEEQFLAAFGEWVGNRLGLKHNDCWFYLMVCHPQRSGHIEDFYRELDAYLIESGFERGLDDECINMKAWRSDEHG